MIEAAMIWNEPNNKSHWDPDVDPDWSLFAQTAIAVSLRPVREFDDVSERSVTGIDVVVVADIVTVATTR